MMKRRTLLNVFAALSLPLGGTLARAGESGDQAALLKALPNAKVSLQQGMQAAAARGRPISAKYEVEDGKLQLSVYTQKADKFAEVIVDHNSGRVAKVEAITEGDDLAAAKAQAGALAKVKQSLKAAADKAEHGSAGYRAIGVTPDQETQGSIAKVILAKGAELKTVTVPLQ